MGFRKYTLNISIRIILLTATCFVFAMFLAQENQWLAKINLIVLVFIQMYLLTRYHIKLHKSIELVFNSWKSKDFSLHLKGESGKSDFPELFDTLDEINDRFKQVEKQKVADGLLFQYITNHVRIGIIASDQNGKIMLLNNAALDLFHLKEAPKSIRNLDDRFVSIVDSLKAGQASLMTFDHQGVARNILMKLGEFSLEGNTITLITLDDIHSELQKNEVETWQNLISVLAHEIMNSVAPINALSYKLVSYLAQEIIDPNTLKKANDSAGIIQRRSKSLMRFVEDYRKMSGVPLPNKEMLKIEPIFNEVKGLFASNHQTVQLDLSTTQDLEVHADKSQLTQVLLNLLLNAYYATERTPNAKITLKAWSDSMHIFISTTDNGHGISDEVIDKIFIPFFTTRDDGSGIGLSLSKQIISLHGGRINVGTEVGAGTTITLTFIKNDRVND